MNFRRILASLILCIYSLLILSGCGGGGNGGNDAVITASGSIDASIAYSIADLSTSIWQVDTIDNNGLDGWYSSLALDSNNRAHIAYHSYYDNPNIATFGLNYATDASNSWNISVIQNGDPNAGYYTGLYTSIDMDYNNRVHMSYVEVTGANLEVKYATNRSGEWVVSMVDSWTNSPLSGASASSSNDTDIFIGTNNKIHISYYDNVSGDLKYAVKSLDSSESWGIYTVDSAGDVGSYSSIAANYKGVYISYYDATNNALKYSTNASGNWNSYIVDNEILTDGNYVGRFTSIGLDSLGSVHISYFWGMEGTWSSPPKGGELRYATNGTGKWKITVLDDFVDGFTSLAVDYNNKVHIAYYDKPDSTSTGGGLMYATNVSGVWARNAVDYAGAHVGWYPSIAVDSNNRAHIAYYDVLGTDLKYAVNGNQ